MKFLKTVFTETNGYPHYLVTSAFEKVKQRQEASTTSTTDTTEEEPSNNNAVESKKFMIKLPYAGKEGECIVKSLKSTLR